MPYRRRGRKNRYWKGHALNKQMAAERKTQAEKILESGRKKQESYNLRKGIFDAMIQGWAQKGLFDPDHLGANGGTEYIIKMTNHAHAVSKIITNHMIPPTQK